MSNKYHPILKKYNIKVYCLFLPNRKKYITHFMKKNKYPTTFIRAINKKRFEVYKNTNSKVSLSLGQISCYFGHLNIYNHFLKTNKSHCLVFEDDVSTFLSINKLHTALSNNINNLPKDYDILFLGYCHEYCKNIKKVNPYMGKSRTPFCTHAYILSRKGVRKLLKYIKYPTDNPIDKIIVKLIKAKKLISYSSIPYIFTQKDRTSIVQNINPTKTHNLIYCK